MTIWERERAVCAFLDELPRDWGAIVIGGYAVNAWTIPRYSEDLDLVFPAGVEEEVVGSFASHPWNREREWTGEGDVAGAFRFTRRLGEDVDLTVDLLFGSVMDKAFRVPVAYEVLRARTVETPIPCVETATRNPIAVADPVALCLLKCQPMRSTDKDDIAGLLLLDGWDRGELHALCRDLLPPNPLVRNLDGLLAFIREDRTIRLIRRRFPQVGPDDFLRRRRGLEADVLRWIQAIQA